MTPVTFGLKAAVSRPVAPVSVLPAVEPEELSTVLQRSHLPALDGLRAIAVFIVIAYHFFGAPIPGDLGVSAFFVLSGFLITWLLLREYDRAGNISLRNFYSKRVLRIFPAYYFFITVSFLIDRLRDQPGDQALGLSGFLYVVNYYNATHGHPSTSIAHAWSLGIEEQFYMLWPLVLLILARHGRTRALAVLAVVVGAVAAWRSFVYLELRVGTPYVYNAFDARFDNLAVGCFLAFCAGQPWFLRFARVAVRSALLPLVTLVLLILSRCAISASYHYSIGFTVDAVLVMVLLVQVVLLHRHAMWSWLQHPVVRYLGVISYPLYLWHVWGLGVGKWLYMLPAVGQFMVGVAVCIIVASGSYFVIEKPFLTLRRRLVMPAAVLAAPPSRKAMNPSLAGVAGLRIAHLIETDGPGGAERVLAHLATALQEAGAWNVAFLPADGEGWLAHELERSGVAIEYFRLERPLSPSCAGWLQAAFRRHGVMVAHSHEFSMAVYGAWASWRAGVPHVITMHGNSYYAGRLRRRLALRAAVALSGRTVAVSSPLARRLSRELWVRRSRITMIPNGVPHVPPERTTLRDELGLRPADRLLVSVGNLYPVKGQRHLIDALASLARRHPTLHVAIAGRGEMERELSALARDRGVADRLHLLGLRSDIAAILAAADVFVLPSLSEGLPLALLEAMFAGCPIVASDVGEVGAVLGHGEAGLLVTPGDPAGLAAALDRLLTDPDRARALGACAAARAAAEYDIMRMVGRYVECYHDLLRTPREPTAVPAMLTMAPEPRRVAGIDQDA